MFYQSTFTDDEKEPNFYDDVIWKFIICWNSCSISQNNQNKVAVYLQQLDCFVATIDSHYVKPFNSAINANHEVSAYFCQ